MPDAHPSRCHAIPWLRHAVLTVACSLLPLHALAAPLPCDPHDLERQDGSALTPEAERRLAERFAPTLVFHALEEYFPVSPLFPIEPAGGEPGADASRLTRLGTAQSRRGQYEALTTGEKARLSTVYYRAYPARRQSRDVIVVEYWLYYVQNDYRIRGNLFPIWVDSSHPNDLEHIHVVLRPGDCGFEPYEIHASSHAGTIPANRYRSSDGDAEMGRRFLVELGSHALAPDIDEDGIFTPGADGDSGYKLLWGIRDRGITWVRYSTDYMGPRTADSIVLQHVGSGSPSQEGLTYRLVPVDELTDAFAQLDLTNRQRNGIFQTDRHWFRRVFGGDNGSSAKLLVPPSRSTRAESIGIDHIASTERGILLGGVFNLEDPGAFVGARYAYLHGVKYVPDVIVQADAVRTARIGYVSTQLLLSYPIDGSIKLLGGKAFTTDSLRFDRTQVDWVAGVEIRLGRMRIYGGSRSLGPILPHAKEFRLAYFF